MSPRLRVLPGVAFAAAAVSVLTAGCGGGPSSPGIDSIAGSTTPASTTTQSGPGSIGTPPAGRDGAQGHFRLAMNVGTADGEKFSACMRKHGVANFPDPNGQGVISIQSGMGIDPASPAFRSAQSACQKLLPNGGQPTPAQQAKAQRQLLALSTCMRAHGIKDFPDPSGGGLRLRGGPGSDLDPSNPTFQSAQQACQKYMPFKTSRTGTKAGGA